MPRWLKITLRIVGGAALLVVLLWLGLAAYVNVNKKSVLKAITRQLNEKINGTLTIGSMETSLLRGFPGVSFELKNVLLRDTNWHSHKHDFLNAKYIYVSVDVPSIVTGQPHIKDLTVVDGNIYLFTDSTGYSNKGIFGAKKDTVGKEKKDQPEMAKFYFKNVNLVFENKTKFKYFKIDFKYLAGLLDYRLGGWDGDVEVDALIKEFNFNIKSGSFLKNKTLVAKLKLSYDKASDILTVPVQDIKLDNDQLDLGAKFFMAEKPVRFSVNIKSESILYKNALSLVSPNIQRNLKYLDLEEPLKLEANVIGLMKFRDTPLVRLKWEVKDNTFILPGAKITDISFTGDYTNEVNPGNGHNDKNSRIHAYGMRGNFIDIPFTADTIEVTNLITPTLEGRFKSKFAVTKLGPVIGDRSFRFKEGTAEANLVYKGPLNTKDDTTPVYVNGYVEVKNAAMSYLPRNLNFTNSSLTLLFRGHDLFIKDVRLHTGSNTLNMNGTVLNFINLYYSDPQKILIDWDIRSPQINLNEFRSLIANRAKYTSPAASKIKMNKFSDRLDYVLEQSSMHMLVRIDKVLYRKFFASNIQADVTMAQKGITLKNVSVNHADGKIMANASIDQGGDINHMKIDATIENVHINDFLAAFENFGQTTITPQNIKGRFFAKAKMTGNMRDNGDFLSNSMNGSLNFNLKDGALVNFEPMMKIGKFLFRRRKMENITFSDLKNTLDVKGDKIYIPSMMIESSALNAKIEGTYAIKLGTDIRIDIPLRNPQKDKNIMDDELKADRQMKGLVLHLRAVDDVDGRVKIKWDVLGDGKPEAADKEEKQEKKSRRIFGRKRKND